MGWQRVRHDWSDSAYPHSWERSGQQGHRVPLLVSLEASVDKFYPYRSRRKMVFRRLTSVSSGLWTRWDRSSIFHLSSAENYVLKYELRQNCIPLPHFPWDTYSFDQQLTHWVPRASFILAYRNEESPIWAVVMVVYGIIIRLFFSYDDCEPIQSYFMYLFVFGCAGSSLLCGGFL